MMEMLKITPQPKMVLDHIFVHLFKSLLENTRIPESEKWHVCAYFHIVLQHAESNEIFSLSNGGKCRA